MSLTVGSTGAVIVHASNRMPKREIDTFVLKHDLWISRQRQRQQERRLKYPDPTETEVVLLKTHAKSIIPERVAYYSKIMGLCPSGIKITSAKKRFGSCSAKNSLCFSYLLMQYPAGAIDYVVVHELAHIRHKNHSDNFYRLIEEYLPDYKRRQALLKG